MREEIRLGAKYVLALSLKDLARNKSLDKISVRDIVDNCGAGRQTFYNHFKDKYDLINWIYESNAYRIRNMFIDVENRDKVISMLLLHIKENQPFYANAFNYEGQNLFLEFLYKNTYDSYMQLIKKRFGENQITDSLAYTLEFYSYGAVNMVKRWSEKGMIECPELAAEKIFFNMPPELKKFV